MYNNSLYNRTLYNKTVSEFAWSAVAYALSQGSATLLVTRHLASEVEAVANAYGSIPRLYYMGGAAYAETYISGTIIRVRIFASEVDAVSAASAIGIEAYGLEFMQLQGINMVSGDQLIIDTENMTVTLNGVNVVDKLTDNSIFFKLSNGSNDITVDGLGTADIKILYKDRWL